MQQIKSFHIKSEPTAKGTGREHLSALVDTTINKWLKENPDIENVRISHSAKTEVSFPEAFIIISFDAPDSKARSTAK